MGLLTAVRDVRTIEQLLTTAEAEARAGGEDAPGAEHLLLAATTLPDGTAGRALARVGVEPQRLRAAVEEAHAGALAAVGIEAGPAPAAPALQAAPTGAFRSTPQAQQVFQDAVALAKAGRGGLTGAHVVVATARLEHGTAARALAALGVDRDRLRAAAEAEAGIG
ncbi:Clp protease N-terminal domain-containing protein [Geodermatophilus nigrescens]|uniref:Clp amino terminal domain-containing protein, pathogenicity island component n=1 Tax=Geodermatophilus nigrescens TaxID=1070870 RepID=A0A1M5G440_9ACTN|nr:Clp protease N-terminal domain-containing protein [Geodermatophilus nigrescens]SHF98414.1 Clp amino terminal domain-containing protein, pathogenicity island component [Geodermatophilus nigrescens]